MFWSRRRRKPLPAPQESSQEDIERAKREAAAARDQLHRVQEQEPGVETAAEKLTRVRRENNIGPRFWDAVSQRRA